MDESFEDIGEQEDEELAAEGLALLKSIE